MTDPRPDTPPGTTAGRDGCTVHGIQRCTICLTARVGNDPDPVLCERCGSSMELIGPFIAHQLPYFKCPVCGRRA